MELVETVGTGCDGRVSSLSGTDPSRDPLTDESGRGSGSAELRALRCVEVVSSGFGPVAEECEGSGPRNRGNVAGDPFEAVSITSFQNLFPFLRVKVVHGGFVVVAVKWDRAIDGACVTTALDSLIHVVCSPG
jgi:hypothetical protein